MQSIKAKAYCLLAKKDYFREELSRKLRSKGYLQKEIEPLMKDLEKRGLIDDEKLARRYIEQQLRKGYGPPVIAQKLRLKAGPIDVPVEESEEAVYRLVCRRYAKDLPENRERVIRSLARRGHSFELIHRVLAILSEE